MRVDVSSTRAATLPVRATRTKERLIVGALLALWCVHLCLYVVLVPPWQHYDEPTHFEYAALIRETGGVPPDDAHIPELRRAIASSMRAHGFYRNPIVPIAPPDLDSPNLSLGINERSHPSLYYRLVALATLPLRHASVEAQLYAGRMVSATLGALLFVAAYALLRCTTDDWEPRCWVLAALALQPAFADNMSAVNSDALSNLVGVLLVLASVWAVQYKAKGKRQKVKEKILAVLRQRSRFLPFTSYLLPPTSYLLPFAFCLLPFASYLLPLLVLALAFNVKRTLLVFGLVVPAAWLLALSRRGRIIAGLSIAACGAGALLWIQLQPWSLADWDGNAATLPTRSAYAGRAAFALRRDQTLVQTLYAPQARTVAGKHITLAAWMRADRDDVAAFAPVLELDGQTISRTVTLSTDWQRVSVEADVPPATGAIRVRLLAPRSADTVWYDALALVAGTANNLPALGEPDASFELGLLPAAPRNLLRNADAERRIPALDALPLLQRTPLANNATLPGILSHTFNPAWIAAAYPHQARALFESVWGVFGWGELSVSGGWFAALALLVLLSLAGALRHTWHLVRSGSASARATWWLCVLAVGLGWGMALLRVHDQPFPGSMFWSFGRYTFVAIVPSMIVLISGLWTIFPASARRQGLTGVLLFLLIFAIVALFGTVLPAAHMLG